VSPQRLNSVFSCPLLQLKVRPSLDMQDIKHIVELVNMIIYLINNITRLLSFIQGKQLSKPKRKRHVERPKQSQ
jgi:hypothetical protein